MVKINNYGILFAKPASSSIVLFTHVVSTGWGDWTHSQSFYEFDSGKFPPKTDQSLWGHPMATEVARSNSHGFFMGLAQREGL